MRYLKLFESQKNYRKIDWSEFQEAVFDIHNLPNPNKDVVDLTYRQQEVIISHFSKKYKVSEDLNSSLFIDNEVVIGFNHPPLKWKKNKYREEVCCWINIKNVKKHQPTKKHPIGRKISKMTSIYITKLEDEWFYVHLSSETSINNNGVDTKHSLIDGYYYSCDQLDGLIQLLKSFSEDIGI
jgi:hypothetical protein